MPGPFGHGPRHSGKEKFNGKAFKKIIRYCKPFTVAIIISFVCAILGAVASIIAPGKIGDLMNVDLENLRRTTNLKKSIQCLIDLLEGIGFHWDMAKKKWSK